MTPYLLAQARAHANHAYPFESAGVVIEVGGKAVYRGIASISTGPDQFDMDPDELAMAEDEGRLLGYIHSHPDGPVTPSEADRKGCNASGLPWWVIEYPGEGWTRLDPAGRKQEGRQFVMGVDDCWSLVREHFGISRDFEREEEFWKRSETPHLLHMTAAGFAEVPRSEMQPGDVILFAVLGNLANHCAVYMGGGTMLHHLPGRLSRIDFIDGKWQSRITHVVRRTNA